MKILPSFRAKEFNSRIKEFNKLVKFIMSKTFHFLFEKLFYLEIALLFDHSKRKSRPLQTGCRPIEP